MKTFLLLILSLMTGCEASSMVKGCRGGWVNFTHGYPDRNSKIQHIDLVRDNHENPPILQTNQKNVWISDGRFSVYHDTESRNIQVGIKDIQQKNFEEYELKFRSEHGPNNKDKEEVDLKSDKGCQEPLIITVSRTAEANILCEDNGNKDDFRVRFFCKENGPICEDVLSTKSALRSNGSFTLTETERGFTVSISDVSAQHAGVYWCGVESTVKISYRAALRRIQLKVEGCEASSQVKGCIGGWVKLTWKYHKTYGKCVNVTKGAIHIKNQDRFSLYHDAINGSLTLGIRQLKRGDSGNYNCLPETDQNSNAVKLIVALDEVGCQEPFHQTAYKKAKTTILCEDNGNKDSRVRFFCKENGPICEDVLSTTSALRSNGSFTLTETERGFTVSISDVSAQHAGVYWWGVESTEGSYRAALRKIQLKVEAHIKSFTRSPTIGQRITYWCEYPEGAPKERFICKGEDPSLCERVVSTAQNTGRFSMTDETVKRNITITVRDVTAGDSGTYWCGAESETETQSNPFYHRFVMTVVQPTATTFSVTSTMPTTAFPKSRGFSINKRNAAAAHRDKEDYIYKEIPERPQKPDSAVFPSNPSASLHYSTINFKSVSGEAAEVLMTKPSSSACEYATVKDTQIATSSDGPSSEDPLYSTVNKTQQQ
ncbi:uncharacterized protein LOC134882822 isoform X2 [Eleginops maclovinus]|uniref:uncharacterized protein LOC134882822 isoform X2 n=1 Tax=Eleginops maclovinus TaxID=56733 RepID=UPI0030803A53